MARARSDDERLDDVHMQKVVSALESDKPITKKDACAILNISYNTARLDKLIIAYKERKEHEAKRRAEKRGTAATIEEINYVVSEYLEGKSIDGIAKGIYRGNTFVKAIIDRYGVPERKSSPDYFKPNLIPDAAMRERFSVGEKVYSARYDSMATIRAEFKNKDEYYYRLWLEDEAWQQFCFQPASELASLEHLRAAGISI